MGFRYGSDGDRDKLAETFKMLGHNVVIYENLKYHQLHATMKKVSEDFRQYDALVVCILSHGKKDSIFTSDCIPVTLDEIKSYFCGISCLVDKPKLFFLQACQGEENQSILHFHVVMYLDILDLVFPVTIFCISFRLPLRGRTL